MEILNRHHLPDDRRWPRGSVYVGRGTPLGNPFHITDERPRELAIAQYEVWLAEKVAFRDPVVLTALYGLSSDTKLVCSCHPKPCHAEVIVKVWSQLMTSPMSWPRTFAFAGIGSRDTPDEILSEMQQLGAELGAAGLRLRSGGADGADLAFEATCSSAEIFLPWPDFNRSRSEFSSPSAEAADVARLVHPAYFRLSQGARKMMARNSHQVLGADLRSPSDFVICWTPDGAESEKERSRKTGGTGQAISLATRWRIPVFNLRNNDAVPRFRDFLKGYLPKPSPSACNL